jgi:hypothetical protein
MDKQEARSIAREQLAPYRRRPYADLVSMIGKVVHSEVTAPSGTRYQFEIQAFWDDKPNGDVRVMCSIDDMGWRAFFPLSDDFIMAPDGTFVGGGST